MGKCLFHWIVSLHTYISKQPLTAMCDWPTSIVVAGCCSSLNSYISVGLLGGCVLKGSVPSLSNLLRWGNKTDRQVLIVGRDSVAINISNSLVRKTQPLWHFWQNWTRGNVWEGTNGEPLLTGLKCRQN
jgi:hypothetical protein